MRIARHLKRSGLALLALSSVAGYQSVYAAGTASTTVISNQATVNYSVGGVAQDPIDSSAATFVVDNIVIHTVTTQDTAAVVATPGGVNVVTFRVTNTGNTAQGYALSATNATDLADPFGGTNADTADMTTPLSIYLETGATAGYDASDTLITSITSIDPDQFATVYVIANVPANTPNGARANVQLAATATVAGNTSSLMTASAGADDPNAVDVVLFEADGTTQDVSQFLIESAALLITKSSTVIADPFNGTTNPKAIPGAIVEYEVVVRNEGAANATSVSVTDAIANTLVFQTDVYSGNTRDVELQVGTNAATYCDAEPGSDTNGDGCYLNGTTLNVGAPSAIATIAPGAANEVAVRFRVEIQ